MASLYERARRAFPGSSKTPKAADAGEAPAEPSKQQQRASSSSSSSSDASPRPPHRVGFIGIARDRTLLVWARDSAHATDADAAAAVLHEPPRLLDGK